MADVDEDVIHPSTTSAEDGDGDADEAQDFRFLAKLSNAHAKSSKLTPSTTSNTSDSPTTTHPPTSTSLLPKRGTKDFEPVPTNQQATALAASRQAMHDALAHERFHAPRSHVLSIYDPQTGRVIVERSKGSAVFSTIGRGMRGGLELLPEEALWLVERGSLDVRWPIEDAGSDEDDEIEMRSGEDEARYGVPMSVQGAYATLLGQQNDCGGGLTLERYHVYAHLKRAGFIVLRADTFGANAEDITQSQHTEDSTQSHQQSPSTSSPFLHRYGLVGWIRERFFARSPPPASKTSTAHANIPLVNPGVYRSYDEIHQRLRLIPTRSHPPLSHSTHTTPNADANAKLKPTYNLYTPRPDSPFRKTSPGTPDFQVCVLSTTDSNVPTLSQLTSLLSLTSSASSPLPSPSPPPPHSSVTSHSLWQGNEHAQPQGYSQPLSSSPKPTAKPIRQTYKSLKSADPSILLAVVDTGVISYMRVNEARFEDEGVHLLFEASGRAAAAAVAAASRVSGNNGKAKGKGRTAGRDGGKVLKSG